MIKNEFLYGLQDRDRQDVALRPRYVQQLIDKLPPHAGSILDMDAEGLRHYLRGLLRSIQQSVLRLRATYAGDDGTSGDIWDCALVGLLSRPNQPYRAVAGTLDFTVIRQQWLRDIARETLRAQRPAVTVCHRYLQSAAIASSVLTGRPNGERPDQLGAADMAAICQALKSAINPKTGSKYAVAHRRSFINWWRRLIEFARAAGLMEAIPGAFTIRPDHLVRAIETSEDDIGRSIPEEWIAHLDAHLHLLGASSNYEPASWSAEDLREMYRVFYQVLRDTGRRPSEIARLTEQPVARTSDGHPSLVYDNTKARRHQRRLPIDESTVTIIEQWRQRLSALPIPKGCAGYLFPAPGARNRARRGHLDASQFRKAFVAWLNAVPQPDGLSEGAAAFPVEDIDPYGFRHAYAQRHADNGTPIDVLRELLDHRDIDTTMGYYRVTLSRKQKAVELVSQLAVDRSGVSSPFASQLAYERSTVATAYGNCTEPSNIKAGGKSCPIRFQCSGCGFYRPDPSYLSAIEQHAAQLRADKATALASDMASWVLDNLNEQIRSYERIADTMRTQLAALPEEQQHAIDSACTDLRKARQAALIPADSLLRRPDGGH